MSERLLAFSTFLLAGSVLFGVLGLAFLCLASPDRPPVLSVAGISFLVAAGCVLVASLVLIVHLSLAHAFGVGAEGPLLQRSDAGDEPSEL